MCFCSVCKRTIWNLDTLIKFFFLLFTPVTDHCSNDSERGSLVVEENDDDGDSTGVGKVFEVRPSAFHRFVSMPLLRGFSSLRQSML